MEKPSRRSGGSVTIQDVARAAGVSAMTVSRVVNGGANVRQSTREAVAAAIEAEHRDGPRVSQAIDAVHHSMGDLQKATLAHVFAMRRVLRPDQAATFDRLVAARLTETGR